MSKQTSNENRGKQVAIGGAIIFALMAAVICLLTFWRYIPGWVGESLGIVAGLISSPFVLEASFFVMGIGIVILLNSWRRKKEGDDFVEFNEQDFLVEDKDR